MASVSTPHSKTAFLHGRWSPEDAARLYGIADWGKGYFGVSSQGHMLVHPERDATRAIDLAELVRGLADQGVSTPVLLRFDDILADRLREIRAAFDTAAEQEGFNGGYSCVYPIKVNQQRHVVEKIRDIGADLGFGLEAGSKPELLAVLGMTTDHPDMPIVCNGFKDREFLETVVLAHKLGRRIYPVVEKFSELERLLDIADRYDVRPTIGVRAKLSSRGAGRWEASGGARSKFGLFIYEVLAALRLLESRGMADCLKLVHFHLGSQISDIRALKNAITELAHIYCELHRLGAGVECIDVGGGLGVDYDGSQTAYDSSVNYSIAEYAADVVYRVKSVCDERHVPHPLIISESGRAMVSYSSVLVFDVLGVSRFDALPAPDELEAAQAALSSDEEEVPQPIVDLLTTRENLTDRNLLESYHDAMQARDEAMSLFSLGYLTLPMRAVAERLFWSIGRQILERSASMERYPEEFEQLPAILSDHYFCNLSIFQSMPDSWAIDQLFPIAPIHRLDEEPTRRAVLADITCDSDGKIDRFVDRRDVKRTLELHAPREGQPYYLGAFLLGAYQEILGDLHNLLGDTHAVHVSLGEDSKPEISEIVEGDTVREVLSYVQIDHAQLRTDMRRSVDGAVRAGRLDSSEAEALMTFFEAGLDGYTYLEE